jgi:histidinol-phosphate aminotransferase
MSYVRSEILAMQGYLPGEQPRGGQVTKLNTNENPYPSSPAVQRAIGRAIQAGLQKYPDPMADAFRNRAAEVLGLEPNWIMCGNGSDDILTILTRAFVGQGELLRLPYPSYILYKTLAQLQGGEAEEIHFEKDWSLSDRFAKPQAKLKLAFLPNPNSPSGTMISPARIRELAAALPCPLIVDEAYVDFANTNSSPW